MSLTVTRQAEELLSQALKELESPKGSVQTGVQKLLRVARLLGEDDIAVWCEIQLGNGEYVIPLTNAVKDFSIEHVRVNQRIEQALQKMTAKRGADLETPTKATTRAAKKIASPKDKSDFEKKLERDRRYVTALDDLGLREGIHYPTEERHIKKLEAGGGYRNIGTIEELYANLITTKKGNDGTFYRLHLREHIDYVRRVAHDKASKLYNKVAFSSTPQTSLDILRAEVDSKLLDLAPKAAEKLMIAFKSVASDSPEEWSHALTSCRRFMEELADTLYPPKDESVKGRDVGKGHSVNRLWAFMEASIESESNKQLAKAHVDYLGSYLERVHKLSNKGVHADLKRTEAIKAVFHTYLTVADILDYLKKDPMQKSLRLNIHTASLDELESVLGISRSVAKEIIKIRVEYGVVDVPRLASVKGISRKTVLLAEQLLSFEPAN